MPKELHDKLVREARKKGLTGDRAKAYVYGTLQKVEKQRPHGRLARHVMQ
jgi:hypothetical protein